MINNWEVPQPASECLKRMAAGHNSNRSSWAEHQDRARIRMAETISSIWGYIGILRERDINAAKNKFLEDVTAESFNAYTKLVTARLDRWVHGRGEFGDNQVNRHLQTMPYKDYLNTPHWQQKRREALKAANYSCQVCNGKHQLNVHHRTYDRRGCELLGDMTVLCSGCHKLFHENSRLEPA